MLKAAAYDRRRQSLLSKVRSRAPARGPGAGRRRAAGAGVVGRRADDARAQTLQTLAVFTIAGLAGPRLTFEIVAVWLLSALIGLPVLAGFKGGIEPFAGPTAGFLVAFLIAGPLVAWLAPRTKGGDLFALFLAGHALVLAIGWAWPRDAGRAGQGVCGGRPALLHRGHRQVGGRHNHRDAGQGRLSPVSCNAMKFRR